MENSTPCKIVTPENFILKFGRRDYVSWFKKMSVLSLP